MSETIQLAEGQILAGRFFPEPVRVETVRLLGSGAWEVGVVEAVSRRFRRVTLTPTDLATIRIQQPVCSFSGDGALLKLGLQAHALGIAYEFDPYFGLSISRVDPLPHQLEAVYDHFLQAARVRFLLADDAGAGKTIMAGLLVRELRLRGLVERVLIVCPANLTFQWQRELREKFDEKFFVLKGVDIRDQFGINQWIEQDSIITSLDLAKRKEILPGLKQVHWDLVIVDEAHRMSSTSERKTERYRLGELLRDTTDHLLLLTATPHRGDPVNFTMFLRLLDDEAFADVASISEAMKNRHAPFYLRRTKEAMVYFPERQADGTWEAKRIFTKRIPRTAGFAIDGEEDILYRDVTRFVKRQANRAAQRGDDPRARAIGFLMALYQRRLASSTYAMRRSLERRARRLEDALAKAQDLARIAPVDLPDPEELEEMDDADRERLEVMLEAVTLASNPEHVRSEVAELRQLAVQAKSVEDGSLEAKLAKLRAILQQEGFFGQPDQRLLLFTEFKETLDYLVAKLREWGFKVGFIHGGMRPGSRDEPNSRLWAEQQFREGGFQILVATEAAGEGINLQCCHILFNYDIPWNPNRLEQRMGRIHRYGQTKDCLIFNFVATNTIEGRVLNKLLEKLQEIRDALDDDAVFNVVGEVLPAAHLERVLRDYYAGTLGACDLEERILRDVREDRFRAICQHALEGLATKKLNLAMLVERRARAQERRLVPETTARFIVEAAQAVPMQMKPVKGMDHSFDPGATPLQLKRLEQADSWRLGPIANRYPRLSTDRETADHEKLEWVTPGHPLFEALRRNALQQASDVLADGACFYSVDSERPARIDVFRAAVVDGLGDTVHERMFAVRQDGSAPSAHDVSILNTLQPAPRPAELPQAAFAPDPLPWLTETALMPFLDEVRCDRVDEVGRIARHVDVALGELISREDFNIGRYADEAEAGVEGAAGLLRIAEDRHQELIEKRRRRAEALDRQRSMSLQHVERMASLLVLPHPARNDGDVANLRPDPETEQIAMRVVIEHERAQKRIVDDVHLKNLGYDITSVDPASGELRLIEIKGIGADAGTVALTPHERRVAEDRRDCFWLYVVTNCKAEGGPTLLPPIRDPARLAWQEVKKVEYYALSARDLSRSAQTV
ncbi:MAG TPA: helicase-related protein [Vicinamibacterales bacterium]|nr:helicase-related protein [Vicinamibacterales bacterium]HOQ59739.1 helicase-related protein [Vicinamibacterales bacterium]HPK71935.1 helicase-related protein [Vicinamibacterales bacterium]